MAQFQKLEMYLLTFVIVFFSGGIHNVVLGCHPNSRELHICLNIYLERDLPFVETIVKGQRETGKYRGGRVLLEDPDIQTICSHAVGLQECYKTLLGECETYWQLDRYIRLMHVLQKTYTYLCSKTTNNVRDLLLSTKCLATAESLIANCSDSGFRWSSTWREVFRMQVSPGDRCKVIDDYKTCLVQRLQGILCGQEAARIYGSLLDVWLLHWCNKDSPYSGLEYLYQSRNFRAV